VLKLKLSFVLFDEVEKASDALWNRLPGILDKGSLRLGDNGKVDFAATMVFLTNLGAAEMNSLVNPRLCFHAPSGEDGECVPRLSAPICDAGIAAMRRKFTPELIDRLDETVVFKALEPEALRRIVDIELEIVPPRIQVTAGSKPFVVDVTDSAKEFLLAGANLLPIGRPALKARIERLLIQLLSNLMASGQIRSGDSIRVIHEGVSPSLSFGRELEAGKRGECPAKHRNGTGAILSSDRLEPASCCNRLRGAGSKVFARRRQES